MRVLLKSTLGILAALLLGGAMHAFGQGTVVVVAHPDTPALTGDALQKIYLGKVVEVGGRSIVPVNLAKGDAIRKTFMEQVMAQDDEKFVAYWTVRRYIGKGSPPREFATLKEQLDFVRSTPGAIGYLADSADARQGLKTLLKKP